jgi:hypothetical protein
MLNLIDKLDDVHLLNTGMSDVTATLCIVLLNVPSRLTWGTTSLRNCAYLPQAQSKGYHVGVAII